MGCGIFFRQYSPNSVISFTVTSSCLRNSPGGSLQPFSFTILCKETLQSLIIFMPQNVETYFGVCSMWKVCKSSNITYYRLLCSANLKFVIMLWISWDRSHQWKLWLSDNWNLSCNNWYRLCRSVYLKTNELKAFTAKRTKFFVSSAGKGKPDKLQRNNNSCIQLVCYYFACLGLSWLNRHCLVSHLCCLNSQI